MALRIAKTNHATIKYGYMHTEISTAIHSMIQMKLYRAARNYVIALCYSNIRQTANGRKPIQQTFVLLRVHQYALIEQSFIYI